MGTYLNPGNSGFVRITSGEYVDKTMLIEEINNTIGTTANLTCISRPRRFGKSYTANMLCAYYDLSCDSTALFKDFKIASSQSFSQHLNKYNVIYIDTTAFISNINMSGKTMSDLPNDISTAIRNDIIESMPELADVEKPLDCLLKYCEKTGRKYVFIIDEWDAVIREAKDDLQTQKRYLNLLREWFKNGNFTSKAIAAAYMTGILPIKKDGTESAISDFREYTILNPAKYSEFTGFTESEVQELCSRHGMNYNTMKEWYDGYNFKNITSVYNPYSVMLAIENQSYESYWKKTTAAESLFSYIDMDYDGLQSEIVRLISGEQIEVATSSFENDVKNFKSKDDVLTLLIHLGYLAFNADAETAYIPNKEVMAEFKDMLKKPGKNKLAELVKKSDELLESTISCDCDAVASALDEIRLSSYAPTYYNNEQALRYIIKFAYITCVDKYLTIEELPSGKGVADVVFVPKKATSYPAMIIELKWNKSKDAAINQIKEKKYPAILQEYGGDIILVGINYDEKNKNHSCKIEVMGK